MQIRRTFAVVVLLLASCGDDFQPFEPLPPEFVIDSPGDLIVAFARSYQTRDVDAFAKLLANDPDRNAEYRFVLSEPTEDGLMEWDYATEIEIHQRLFNPESTEPGDPPVPAQMWLQSVDIALSRQEEWTEHAELYTTAGGVLDPTVWRARSAVYATSVFFAMLGDLDYLVDGEARFTVIEDLEKSPREEGRFLILIWEDLGSSHPFPNAVEPTTWSALKDFYR